MTGKNKYPAVEGSVNVTVNGKKFSLEFTERTITVKASEQDFSSLFKKFPSGTGKLGPARNISGYFSRLGISVRLDDGKGVMFSMGRGTWTPFGHFSFKPRLRRYLKKN